MWGVPKSLPTAPREGGGCMNVCVCARICVRTHTRVEDSSLSVKQKYTRGTLKVYNFRYYHSSVSNDEPMPAGPGGVSAHQLAYILGVCERTFGQDWGCSKFAKRQMPKIPVESGGERITREKPRNLETSWNLRTQPQYGTRTDAALMPVICLQILFDGAAEKLARQQLAGGVAVCLPISTCCAEYPPTCTAGTDRQIDISPSRAPAGTTKCCMGGGRECLFPLSVCVFLMCYDVK